MCVFLKKCTLNLCHIQTPQTGKAWKHLAQGDDQWMVLSPQ